MARASFRIVGSQSSPRPATRVPRVLAAAAWLVALAVLPVRASAAATEYQVKAAFLSKFVQFAEWPPSAFADAAAPISIGVLGEDPLGGDLDAVVQGQAVGNRKVIVKRSRDVDDLKACHLLFISKSEKAQVPRILRALGNSSVLTVGETDGFAQAGGAINFYLDNNKVRFEINPDAAQRRGIKISAQLLRVARVVKE